MIKFKHVIIYLMFSIVFSFIIYENVTEEIGSAILQGLMYGSLFFLSPLINKIKAKIRNKP